MISLPDEFDEGHDHGDAAGPTPVGPSEPTGRYLVVLADALQGDTEAMSAALRSVAGVSDVAQGSDFSEDIELAPGGGSVTALLFPRIGVAVVTGEPDRLAWLAAAAEQDERIEAIEPERTLYAFSQPSVLTVEYLRGYRDAAVKLYEHANGTAEVAVQFEDTPEFTWGLQATKVATSRWGGDGVAVAMLDTGLDLSHPDFANRRITSRSFVSDETPQDGHGHGTHVTGTSSGPADPPGESRRYGVASNDSIFIGKVLSNRGSGTDAQILAGIEWAITNQCRVISLSLGANVRTVSPTYEATGRRALDAGCLIVAAAGNNADRARGSFGFVARPANSPSIMAVGAVDSQLAIANFSARSNPVSGGQVDIVGPGVAVYSSWPVPTPYRVISGTSMSTPHVAGIAALLSQTSGATGSALWGLLVRTAQQLPLPSVDVGAGLVQAPQ